MEKNRKFKILSIVLLVMAIAGMTLGFAAFSTTLSISSSASVTPNRDSFGVKFFLGLNNWEAKFNPNFSHLLFKNCFDSLKLSYIKSIIL